MRKSVHASAIAFLFAGLSAGLLGGCASRAVSHDLDRAPASKYLPSAPTEADPKWLTSTPIPIFTARAVTYHGQTLKPYELKKGEFVFVHSARTLWSPRVSGQAFFDTFLFGCEDLPPSPLDRVTNEGHLLKAGEGALIEEYPDHVASFDNQPVAWVRCTE